MGIFVYSATAGGKKVTGTIRAPDESTATQELRKRNLVVHNLKRKSSGGFFAPKPKSKGKDVAAVTRQLATMINAGLTLLEALETLFEQASDPGTKDMLDHIIERVRAGSELSAAMALYPKVFNKIYVNMVKAAEASGQLDKILLKLADYLESSEELKREIKGALIYPVMSLGLILTVATFLVVAILPKFKKLFEEMQMKELPIYTQVLLDISDFMRNQTLVLVGGFVTFIIAFNIFKRTRKGEYYWHAFLLHVPIFGQLIRKTVVSRFCRTLSTMLEAGVNMISALEIAAATSGNRIIEKVALQARESVTRGKTLYEPLAEYKIFPPIVVKMVNVGEKTGALETLLEKISTFFEDEVRAAVKGLTATLEPILIATLGLIVGGIVLAVFAPIMEIQQKLTK